MNGPDNPAILRSQLAFVYETPAADAPRITDSNVSAFNWTGIEGVPSQVTTHYEVAGDGACVLTAPDGTIYKEYYGTDWQKGLTTLSEVWSGSVKQKWTTTAWTQDNTTAGIKYETNPRVTETNVYDKDNNRRRLTTSYATFSKTGSGATVALPSDVYEYAADAVTFYRYLHTDYEHQQTSGYLNYHILSVPWRQFVYDGSYNLMSQVAYSYDAGGEYLVNTSASPTQHDSSYSTSSPTFRGNLTEIKQHDVTDPSNESKTRKQKLGYDINGSVVFTRDALNHQASVSYADSFSDSVDRNTFAYPTTTTDPDSNSSYLQYNFDFGATTRAQGPPPAGQSQGAIQTMSYYSSTGQLERVTTTNTGAYKRFWYGPNYTASFATVNNVADEAYSIAMFDGAGRVIGVASNHPGSAGGYKAQVTSHDLMGRPVKTSNPTEINGNWTPSGDDAAGWLYTQQTYSWQGKPLVTTNPDGTTKEASYSGCGCAGGEVVTLTDEGTLDGGVAKRRQQKIYSDVLGRTVKTEVLNWDGSGPNGTAPGNSVYSATVNSYNTSGQVTQVRQYAGGEGSGTYQDTTMTYDGYGRLKTKHVPEQNAGTVTTWNYNADNTIQTITDARGAITTYGYNSRRLVTGVTNSLTGLSTVNTTYGYDAASNRTSMSHTVGGVVKDSASYSYDQLSRMTSETRHINALAGNAPNYGYYTIGYGYTLSNALQSVTDPFSSPTNFSYDAVGRTVSVTGSFGGTNYTYANNVSYRAWGAVKSATAGGAPESISYDSRLQPTHFEGPNMRYDYTYHDDGQLKGFKDLDDQVGDPHFVQFHYMSRAYSYDHAARVSGVSQLPNHNVLPPFSGSYGYDAFDNLTSRGGKYALNSYQSDTAGYTNNRRNGWSYDAEGNITSSTDNSDSGGSSTRTWTYDAEGTLIATSEIRNGQTTTNNLVYDGDGELLYESSGSISDYLIRSTVLGTVLTKLTATGGKDITYVPTNGLVAPMQYQNPGYTPFISWVRRDALGIQEKQSNSLYSFYAADPLGSVIPNSQPPISGPPPYVPFYGASYGGVSLTSFMANNLATGCNFQGRPMDCNSAMVARMGLGFASNLPGFYLDNALAEQSHVENVRKVFAAADKKKMQQQKPKLKRKNPVKLTPEQRKKREEQRKRDSKKGNYEDDTMVIVPLGNLQNGLENLLKGDCGAFVQKLIDMANSLFSRGAPRATSFWDAYSRIKDAGGYQLNHEAENGATISGDLFFGEFTNPSLPEIFTAGPGTVHMQPFGTIGRAANSGEVAIAQARYVFKALHETLHLAKRGGYSDRELALAGHAVDKTTPPDLPKDAILSWSGNYDTVLQKHCPYPFR